MPKNTIVDGKDLEVTAYKKGGSYPGAWCQGEDGLYMVKIQETNNFTLPVREVMANRLYGYLGDVAIPEVDMVVIDREMATDIAFQHVTNAYKTVNYYVDGSIHAVDDRVSNYPSDMDDFMSLVDCALQAPLLDGRYAGVISKAVARYSDLGEEIVNNIAKDHRLPEQVSHNGTSYPLHGLAQAAAMSRILGDNDWLGGRGGNLGFIIAGDKEAPYAQVVMVDPGQAFYTQDLGLTQTRDLGASSAGLKIEFDNLSESQTIEFLNTIAAMSALTDAELKNALTGGGALVSEISTFLKLTETHAAEADAYVDGIVKQVRSNINEQLKLYKSDLLLYSDLLTTKPVFPVEPVREAVSTAPADVVRNYRAIMQGHRQEEEAHTADITPEDDVAAGCTL